MIETPGWGNLAVKQQEKKKIPCLHEVCILMGDMDNNAQVKYLVCWIITIRCHLTPMY